MNEEETSLIRPEYENILISVANPDNAKQLVRLAQLISTRRATLHIMNVTKDKPFPEREKSWRQGSQVVMDTTHYAQKLGRIAKPLAATSSSIPGSIVSAAEEVEADLIVMGWFGRITPVAVRRSSVVNKVLHRAPCDVTVFKSRKDLDDLKKVVIPVGPNKPNTERLELAETLLEGSDAKGEFVHVLTEGDRDETLEEATDTLNEITELISVQVETRTIHASSVLQGLLTGSRDADLVLMGPGREWVFDRFLFGRTADNLTNRVEASVVMFKGSEYSMVAWSRGFVKALKDLLKRHL
ncbi:universal stress protein [Candidatus Bipolaricaulota bacterium]|nr:universal stress protein [Candidatus Bipolaricaulota bacterium]